MVLGGDIVEEGTSLEEMREVFYHLGCLYAEYERIAFTAGLCLSAQLMLELTAEP